MTSKVGQGMKARPGSISGSETNEISGGLGPQSPATEGQGQSILEPVLERASSGANDGDLEAAQEHMAQQAPTSDNGAAYIFGVDVGPQENGDLRVAVTIPEEYVEPVKQWAEAEKKTVEEWLSGQLAGYLESWGSPARGK